MLAEGKWYFFIFVSILALSSGASSFAQDYPEYEEIALFLDVPNLGGAEIDVLIKGDDIYLPITDFFDFLSIRNLPSPDLDTISGFFINQEATFSIERENNLIRYGKDVYELKPGDLIRTEYNLFMKGQLYGQIFGLECEFSFRNMSVRVNTNLELPAIREMRQKAMRKNMNRLVGEIEADTAIGRKHPIFHFGMADWSVNITERTNGPTDARLNLGLGAMLAGGEATVSLNYNSHTEFTEKQQYYLWRYVNNDNRALRQVMIGKIATGATSSIYDPVVGVQLTNSSTKFKRSFGTYTLSDRTEPDWIVELYVNNELIDYTTADPSGFFTFQVPLVYGNTNVRLKFYGPWGEERVREQNITIPFNFVPKKTLEYKVSAGMIQDNFQSKFSRAQASYGLFRSVTLGGGVEYISSIKTGELMPFVNGSFRLASNLMLSGEYSPEVRSKGTLTYRLPSSLQFDIDYVYYTEGQQAINNNFREERKISMSLPIRFKHVSFYNRFTVNQLVLPNSNYTTSEWLLSGALFGVSTNITSYAIFIGNTKPYYYSDFSMSFRLPKSISLQPRLQYSYTNKKLLSAKVLAEKRVLKKAYLTASYEHNFQSEMYLFEVGFRYDFKFAQTSFLARVTKKTASFVQFARGSIINDSQTNYVTSDKRSNVGKGGVSILAYLDMNANGIRDEGERKAYGLNIRANSGRIEKREQDTTIRIFGLEPYTDCFIEFDQNSFDNIAWRLNHESMSVAVDPNMIKLVEIPISVAGEAAGMVRIERKGVIRGIGRIVVNFYNKNQKRIGRTLSETDGYFSYFGLEPGTYDVRIDSNQLQKLGMLATPDSINFNIAAILDGDYIDGLDFVLKMDTATKAKELEKEVEPMDMMVFLESELVVDNTMGNLAIKLGAFKNEAEADTLRDQLSTILGKEAKLVFEDNQYQVRIDGFTNKKEIEGHFPAIQSKGINKISMISLNQMAEPRLATDIPVTDTITTITGNDIDVLIVHNIVKEDTIAPTDNYVIELGVFADETKADSLRESISTIQGKEAKLVFEENQYKVQIDGFTTAEEVVEIYPELQSKGINEISLISIQAMAETRQLAKVPGIKADTVIMYTEKDTTVLVLNEIIKDDTSSTTDSYEIQIGEYIYENEADSLRSQISELQGREAQLVYVDGYYKVLITGLATRNEIEDYIPIVSSKGIDEISVTNLKGTAETRLSPEDIVIHEIVVVDMTSDIDSYVIQVGAFKQKSYANRLKKKLAAMLDKEVIITVEDGYYKVRIAGFESLYELEKYIPTLIRNGIREIWVVTIKGMLEQDTDLDKVQGAPELIDTFTEKDTTYFVVYEPFEEDKTSAKDSYAIQLGAFSRKINADVLKIKMNTLLDREVEIFVEDEIYIVRIDGFNSRIEVDNYIPVLKENGLTEVRILNLKEAQTHRVVDNRIDTIQPVDVDSTKTIIDTKRKKKITIKTKTVRKVAPRENEVEKKQVVERRKEENRTPAPVAPRNTIEDRMLEAEYRTDIYQARWPDVEFVIQIAASKSISDPEVIKQKLGLSGEVNVNRADEWYRFNTGHFIKYWRAREYRNILRSRNGMEDAIIVAYKNGKKIMFNDLLAIAENTPLTGLAVRPPLEKAFSVQVTATKDGNISVASLRELYEVDEEIFKEYDENDGLYRYSIGNFTLYTDAAKVRNQIKLRGFRGVFVIGYKEGKRVKDLKTLLE